MSKPITSGPFSSQWPQRTKWEEEEEGGGGGGGVGGEEKDMKGWVRRVAGVCLD